MRAYLCKYPGCTHMVDTPRTYCKQHAALSQAADSRKADAPRPQWAGAERPNEALYNTPRWLGYRNNPGQVMQFNAPLSIKAHSPAVYGAFIKELI